MYKYIITTYTQHHLAMQAAESLPSGANFEILYTEPFRGCLAAGWNHCIKKYLVDGNYDQLILTADDIIFKGDVASDLISGLDDSVILTHAGGPWCSCIDRRFTEVVGYLDEGFYPVYFEDTDIFHRIDLAGYKIMQCSSLVAHIGQGTLSTMPDVEEMYRRNWLRYVLKWGGDSGNEVFRIPFNGVTEEEAYVYFEQKQ